MAFINSFGDYSAENIVSKTLNALYIATGGDILTREPTNRWQLSLSLYVRALIISIILYQSLVPLPVGHETTLLP